MTAIMTIDEPRQRGTDRLHMHEVLRHGMGNHADPAVSGAGRLCRVVTELHE